MSPSSEESRSPPDFSLGVEEEYQIVDPESRELRSLAGRALQLNELSEGQEVQPELYRSQLEIGTPVCRTLSDVRAELKRLRRQAAQAARRAGGLLAAAGTHPFSHWADQEVTEKQRYQTILGDYQQLAREQVIFGNHVHVAIADREAAIQTMNRVRPWLAPLIALAANSPFWLGRDSGYASFGREMWRRWPMAGVPPAFRSRSEYEGLVERLVSVGGVREPTKLYWDVRPSERFQTLEFRVTDVCLSVDEAVLVAALVRALAITANGQAERGESAPEVSRELLVTANWRASRWGVEGELVDLERLRLAPAREVLDRFVAFVRPALAESGGWEEASGLLQQTLSRGTGAARQRAAFERRGRLEDVVDLIVRETDAGGEERA